MKKRIGILTTFYEFSSAYSLCSVVEAQLAALVKHGYETVLFVHDNFKEEDVSKLPKGVEVRKVIPRFLLVDYSDFKSPNKDLEEQAQTAYEAIKEHTADIDIILEHDLIFQGWFLPYCMAIHKLAEESNIQWFHWIHSVPNLMPKDLKFPHTLRFRLPRNSKLIYLNNQHLIRAAEAYSVFPKDVRVVHNPVDPRLYWDLDEFTTRLVDKYDLLSADYMQVYPVSTPRMMSGKQLDMVIDIFGKLKEQGHSVRLVVCNAHANDKREKAIVADAQSYAQERGLYKNEVIFTSLEEAPEYEQGVDRKIVSDLFLLSNLFIFPSRSENCSLILLEAMMSNNLLVLNESVPPLKEFGRENALYFRFGGLDEKVEWDNRPQFAGDVSKIIHAEMLNNRTLKASNLLRKQFNYDWIFKNQIEPLFYEQ